MSGDDSLFKGLSHPGESNWLEVRYLGAEALTLSFKNFQFFKDAH